MFLPLNRFWRIPSVLVFAVFAFVARGGAQNIALFQQPVPAPVPDAAKPPANTKPPAASVEHRFWDRENDLLFAGMATSRVLDFASTIHNRNRGLDEGLLNNQIVDNHPLFLAIEAATATTSIGISYLFHRTGHHRLERWTSIVHMGVATTGAIRNYSLKSPH